MYGVGREVRAAAAAAEMLSGVRDGDGFLPHVAAALAAGAYAFAAAAVAAVAAAIAVLAAAVFVAAPVEGAMLSGCQAVRIAAATALRHRPRGCRHHRRRRRVHQTPNWGRSWAVTAAKRPPSDAGAARSQPARSGIDKGAVSEHTCFTFHVCAYAQSAVGQRQGALQYGRTA